MRYTGLSERTVRTCLNRLEAGGIIRPCDPDLVAARIKRADRRPQGWDLDLTLARDDLNEPGLTVPESQSPVRRAGLAPIERPHHERPPNGVQPPHPAAPAPPAPAPVQPSGIVGTGGMSAFQACVIQRESGGNPSAVNPSSGAGGLYGFLPSTWQALGHSGLPENASVAEQNQAFAQEYTQSGTAAWAPYDGC